MSRSQLAEALIDRTNERAFELRFKKPAQAETLARQALELAERCGYEFGVADARCVLAVTRAQTDPTDALELAYQALTVYKMGERSRQTITAMVVAARCLNNLAQFSEAICMLRRAYDLSLESKNEWGEAMCLLMFGVHALGREEFEVAREYFNEATIHAQRAGNEIVLHSGLVQAAWCSIFTGDSLPEPGALEQSVKVLGEIGVYHHQATGLCALAILAVNRGELARGRKLFDQALRRAIRHQHPAQEAEIRIQRARLLHQANRNYDAIGHALKAVHIASERGLRALLKRAVRLLASSYEAIEEFELAYGYLQWFVEVEREIQDAESEAVVRESRLSQEMEMTRRESQLLLAKNQELAQINLKLQNVLSERETLQRELERHVTYDELTGALSRRKTLRMGSEMVRRSQKGKGTSHALLLDIDHFKAINDTYGHAVGDEVLRRFVSTVVLGLRSSDVIGRLGGEEFCVLLPNTTGEEAFQIGNRVLELVRSMELADLMPGRSLSVSIGMTEIQAAHSSIEAVLHSADMALYKAKHSGRDRLESASDTSAAA